MLRLQWGRDLSAAETGMLVSLMCERDSELQWGRDLSAAETSRRADASITPVSVALQWGRDLSAAETDASLAHL